MDRWNRRRFVQGVGVTGLALLAGCGRLPGQAPARVYRLGYLTTDSPDPPSSNLDAFRQGLRDLGYDEGQNLVVEYRHAEGQLERLPELAAELAQLQVDVIVTLAAPPTLAARQATETIPIVFTNVNDPVGLSLVASLARPGGNITGLSTLSGVTSGKRLELLKETVPGVSRVAAFWSAANPGQVLVFQEAQEAAQALGLQLQPLGARSPDDFDSLFDVAIGERADALVVLPAVRLRYPSQLVDFAAKHGLPAMYSERAKVEAGGLMAFEPNYGALNRRAAYYVDRILKGTKPADLPVEQPREFDFVINLRTAQALGLTIPPHVLLQATEVIQ